MTVFGGISGKNAPKWAFFGALRANKGTFRSITAKVLKIKLSFWNSCDYYCYRFVEFGPEKSLSFFGPLCFFRLEFFRKRKKKSGLADIFCLPIATEFIWSTVHWEFGHESGGSWMLFFQRRLWVHNLQVQGGRLWGDRAWERRPLLPHRRLMLRRKEGLLQRKVFRSG